MADQQQSFANHTRWVPLYHFVALGILTINLLWRLYYLYRAIHGQWGRLVEANAAVDVLLAVALALVGFYARDFALAVQDRVIRGEERERLARLLPADWRGRIGELTPGQLVALRFASDDELPALAQKVLQDKITDRTAIKKMVRNWRADHLRV